MSATATSRRKLDYTNRTLPNINGWQDRHLAAIARPNGEERGIVSLIAGWLTYADTLERENGARIGDDGYLGPPWARIGVELIHMLSGPMGTRLDGGTLDSIIRGTLAAEGFDADKL